MALSFQTLPATGAKIGADPITTYNGVADVGGAYVQYGKLGWGAAGILNDVSLATPMPTQGPANTTVSGTFTAADLVVGAPASVGAPLSGASTTGSVISIIVPSGFGAFTLLVKGYVDGTVYIERSTNSTNGTDGDWSGSKARLAGASISFETYSSSLTANGYFEGGAQGFTRVRARFVGGSTFPTLLFTLSQVAGSGTNLNSKLEPSSNTIGFVQQAGTWNLNTLDTIVSGNLTAAGQTVVLFLSGQSTVNVEISGTWTGSLMFEGLVSATWNPVNGTSSSTSGPATTTTVNGTFRLTPAAFAQLRVNAVTLTSGTAVINIRGSTGAGGIYANQILPTKTLNNSLVSTANSSAVNLAASAVFTGTSEDVSEYSMIVVSIFASHASATDGLAIQQSSDGTNWDWIDNYTIPAANGKSFSAPVQGQFYRLVYTNGATLTTSLRIQTLLSKATKKGSSVRPQDGRTNDSDAEEVLGFMAGYNGASWDRLRSTLANGLAVDVTRMPANQSVNISQTNGVAPLMGNGLSGTGSQRVNIASDNSALPAAGQGAVGSAVPAGATLHGLRATTANPTNATAGNMIAGMADKAGRAVVAVGQVRELIGVQQTAVAVVTADQTIVTAGGAGVFNDISQLIITTAGAAAQTITIKDAAAGTTRLVLNYPNAASAPGAPMVINFNPPLVQAAANAAWAVTQSAATACNYTVVFAKNL